MSETKDAIKILFREMSVLQNKTESCKPHLSIFNNMRASSWKHTKTGHPTP